MPNWFGGYLGYARENANSSLARPNIGELKFDDTLVEGVKRYQAMCVNAEVIPLGLLAVK